MPKKIEIRLLLPSETVQCLDWLVDKEHAMQRNVVINQLIISAVNKYKIADRPAFMRKDME